LPIYDVLDEVRTSGYWTFISRNGLGVHGTGSISKLRPRPMIDLRQTAGGIAARVASTSVV
jgi:hypothetical protein